MRIPVFVIVQKEVQSQRTMLNPPNVASHGVLSWCIDKFVFFLFTESFLDQDYLFS